MPRLAIGNIEKKILDGIEQAERDYFVWSNGDSLEYAPEYFITTCIGRKIRGIQTHELWISFEHNIDHALREAKGKKRGRPSAKLQLSGRYDMVVWRKNNTPRCVIEVKHRVTGYNNLLQSDVSRICEAFSNPKMNMQCGFFAFYTSGWQREYKDGSVKTAQTIVTERVNRINEAIQEDLPGSGIRISFQRRTLTNEEDYASLAVVFRFSRAKR